MQPDFCPFCGYGCGPDGFCPCQKPIPTDPTERRMRLLNLKTAIELLSLPARAIEPGERISLMPSVP